MGSDKKETPSLNPNKPKKRSVKDIVIKKFDTSSSPEGDYKSEFKSNDDEDVNARPKLRDDVLESAVEEPIVEEPNVETKEESQDNAEEIKESSDGGPIGSVKEVIKKFEHESAPSKPTLNPSPNDLKPKPKANPLKDVMKKFEKTKTKDDNLEEKIEDENVDTESSEDKKEESHPIKDVIKKTESEVKAASDNTLDSVRDAIKKLDSESDNSRSTLDPTPNDLPKSRPKLKEEPEEESEKAETKEKSDDESENKKDSRKSKMSKDMIFSLNILDLRIGIFGHKIKVVDIVIVFIGLFLIFCGGIASMGVADKVVDNVVFGERSTMSFLLVILGILFITAVLGPALIKRSIFKGFYEQLQSIDAEPKTKTNSDEEKEEEKTSSDDES